MKFVNENVNLLADSSPNLLDCADCHSILKISGRSSSL
jgi:hypothetical protein